MNVLIEKKRKKAYKGRKKHKHELRDFEKMEFIVSEEFGQSLDNSNAFIISNNS